jgi:hypothetical protein
MLAIYPNPKPCRAGFPTLGTAAACCGVLRMTVERLPSVARGIRWPKSSENARAIPSVAEKPITFNPHPFFTAEHSYCGNALAGTRFRPNNVCGTILMSGLHT